LGSERPQPTQRLVGLAVRTAAIRLQLVLGRGLRNGLRAVALGLWTLGTGLWSLLLDVRAGILRTGG
jgi:hypothetical protein